MGRTRKTSESDDSGASYVPAGLIDVEDVVWGFSGDTLTKSFIIDGAFPDSASWGCFKDSKSTDRAKIEVISKDKLKFKIDKPTLADSGLYGFCCPESKSLTYIKVCIIDGPKWNQPTVRMAKSGGLCVEWEPPTVPAAITGYEVECREKGESRWTKVTSYKITECEIHDQDAGTNKVLCYRVIAYNKIRQPWTSEPSKDFPYQIVQEPPKIHLSRNYFHVNSGEQLSLSIEITGEYGAISWVKYRKNSPKTNVKLASDEKTYKISKTTTEDAGKYEIVASNRTGSDTAYIYVDVTEPPAPRMHFQSMKSVFVGEPLELCVDIQGKYDSVTWEKDSNKLPKENGCTYRKEQTTLDDSGEYLITAKNGDKSSVVRLKVTVFEKQRKSTFEDKHFIALLVAFVVCFIGFIVHEYQRVDLKDLKDLKGEIKQLKQTHLNDLNGMEIGIINFNEELKKEWIAIKNRSINVRPDSPPPPDENRQELLNRLSAVERSVTLLKERNENLEKDVGILKNNVTDLKKDVNKAFDRIDELNVTVLELENNTERMVASLSGSIEALNIIVSGIEEKMTKEFNKNEKFREDLENRFTEVNEATHSLKGILDDSQEVIALLRSNAFHRESLLIAIGILVFAECAVVIWVYQISRNMKRLMTRDDPNTSMSSVEVIQRIPRSVTLERSVGVIGFSNAMSGFHHSLINTALHGQNINTTFSLITRHNQLLELPRCQLYVMCVEFTERHVIIEEQGLGLGDLKRCTHDAIRRMGADLVIIYSRDPGSRSLPHGHLFNKEIYCVSNQPELIALKEVRRFMSIYEKLSELQTKELVQTVNKCLQTRY